MQEQDHHHHQRFALGNGHTMSSTIEAMQPELRYVFALIRHGLQPSLSLSSLNFSWQQLGVLMLPCK
jgi:hypothetical protein